MQLLLFMLSCSSITRSFPLADTRADGDISVTAAQLERFRAGWLEPAELAPPIVRNDFHQREQAQVHVAARIVRAETASWNQWGDNTARLFNDRAALVFEVRLDADDELRWLPQQTALELNREGDPIPALSRAEAILTPLIAAAVAEERSGLPGDFVARTRATGPFRAQYLDPHARQSSQRGLIVFARPSEAEHILGMRLSLGLRYRGEDLVIPLVFD